MPKPLPVLPGGESVAGTVELTADPSSLPLALTAAEVARELGITVGTAYKLMRSRTLPTLRWGRNVRVPADALRRWVEDGTEGAKA